MLSINPIVEERPLSISVIKNRIFRFEIERISLNEVKNDVFIFEFGFKNN